MFPYAVAAAGAAAAIACSRGGNCAIICERSSALSVIQRAISSSERPQPRHSAKAGWTMQTRVQGVSMAVSTAIWEGPDGNRATIDSARGEEKASER